MIAFQLIPCNNNPTQNYSVFCSFYMKLSKKQAKNRVFLQALHDAYSSPRPSKSCLQLSPQVQALKTIRSSGFRQHTEQRMSMVIVSSLNCTYKKNQPNNPEAGGRGKCQSRGLKGSPAGFARVPLHSTAIFCILTVLTVPKTYLPSVHSSRF